MIPTILRGKANRSIRSYPLLSLFDEVNRLFEDDSSPVALSSGARGFAPKFDVKETEKSYILTGEFPGMESKDINIELKDNSILFTGEKRYEHENKEGERTHVERYYGSFSRRIEFDVEIDEDNSTAEMKNGVLSVIVPKSSKVIKGAKKLNIKNN